MREVESSTLTGQTLPLWADLVDAPTGVVAEGVVIPSTEHAAPPEDVNKVKERVLDGLAATAVVADFPGVLEGIWFVTTAAASQVNNPYLAAGLTTAATGALVTGSSWGVARLMAKETGGWVMNKVHKGLGKLGIKSTAQTSMATDTAITFVAGVPIMSASKQSLDPTRTESQNRKHGIKTG
jgi:hypothetical protein